MTRPALQSSAKYQPRHGDDLERYLGTRSAGRPQEIALDCFDLRDDRSSEFTEGGDEGTNDELASLPRARTNVEAVMGLLAAFFIGLPAPLVATAAVANLPVQNLELVIVLSVITLFATGYLGVTVIRIGGRAVEGDRPGNSFYLASDFKVSQIKHQGNDEFYIPLALAMAIRLPKWWAAIRPFIALWWLGHFVVAAIFGHMATRHLNGINNPGLVAIPMTLAVTMAFLFAANLYLMLAIAVGFPRPRIWLIAWRYRFFVDMVITVTMIACT